jgi:hypothetical protein
MIRRALVVPTLIVCGVDIKSPASGIAIPVFEMRTSTDTSGI